jgi:hypothetical protein
MCLRATWFVVARCQVLVPFVCFAVDVDSLANTVIYTWTNFLGRLFLPDLAKSRDASFHPPPVTRFSLSSIRWTCSSLRPRRLRHRVIRYCCEIAARSCQYLSRRARYPRWSTVWTDTGRQFGDTRQQTRVTARWVVVYWSKTRTLAIVCVGRFLWSNDRQVHDRRLMRV